MVSGEAFGSSSLSSVANAYPSPTPISLVTLDNNPFYAINRIQFVQDPIFNPSSLYQFTRRIRIQATAASNIARIRDLIWFPVVKINAGPASSISSLVGDSIGRVKWQADADSSSELTSDSNGVITKVAADADSNPELVGDSNASVNVFAEASGILDLSVSGEARISLLRMDASSSSQLTGFADGNSTSLGIAESVSELIGDSLANVTVFGDANGELSLESESNPSVNTFGVADSTAELTDEVDGRSVIFASASSTLNLTSDSEANTVANATASSSSELEGDSSAEVTLLRGESEGNSFLLGASDGDLSFIPASASSQSTLAADSNGVALLSGNSASSTSELTGDSDGDIVVDAFLIAPYSWDLAVDYSDPTNLLAGNLSTTTGGTGFTGQSTGGFTAAAIGSSRINQAYRNGSYQHIVAPTIPFTTSDSMHYRFIGRAPTLGTNRLIHSFGDVIPGTYAPTMQIEVGTSNIIFRVAYSTFISPNWFVFPLATPVIATNSAGDYLLIDINLSRSGANLVYDFYVNGSQSSYTFAASQRGYAPHWTDIDRSRLTTAPGSSNILFVGFVVGSNISFAQHQSDYNNSGI